MGLEDTHEPLGSMTAKRLQFNLPPWENAENAIEGVLLGRIGPVGATITPFADEGSRAIISHS